MNNITTYSSLAINDRYATHRIIVAHPNVGFGVFGYYNELVAKAVKDDLLAAGYDCRMEVHSVSTLTGIHPAIITGNL